jgi:hypothetical protein
MRTKRTEIPLSTKVEQLLTEAVSSSRVAQALFGFQLIAMLTNGFDQLPPSAKMMHTFAIPQIPKALELRPANSNSRDGRRLLEHFRFGKWEQIGGIHRAEESLEPKATSRHYRVKELTQSF